MSLLWYDEVVLLREMCPDATVRELAVSARPGWSAFNPSIAFAPTVGYACIVRAANYRMDVMGRYLMPGDTIETHNYFCPLDSKLNIVDMVPLVEVTMSRDPVPYPWVLGMEDARLYHDGEYWRAYGTVRYHHPDGLCRIAEDVIFSGGLVNVQARRIFEGDGGQHEKNWAVLMDRPGVFVHSWPKMPAWRGSAQLLPYENGYLTAVHEVDYTPNYRRTYYTRLVKVVNRGGNLYATHSSPRFAIIRFGIEFVAGATIWQTKIVLSFGYYDERAMLVSIPIAQVPWHGLDVTQARIVAARGPHL